MYPKFKLDPQLLENLKKQDPHKSYCRVPDKLRKKFQDHNIYLQEDAALFTEEPGQLWRVVDGKEVEVRAFSIRRTEDRLTAHQRTFSGWSDVLWDYQIFNINLDRSLHYGWERHDIAARLKTAEADEKGRWDKIRKKWDFFIRPQESHVGLAQKRRIWEIREERDRHQESAEKCQRFRKICGFATFSALLYLTISYLLIGKSSYLLGCVHTIAMVTSIVSTFLLILSVALLKQALSRVHEREDWIRELEKEVDHLNSQVPRDLPTVEEMDRWYTEEIEDLSERALKDMGLSKSEILALNEDLRAKSPAGITGILLADGAVNQLPTISGAVDYIDPLHLKAAYLGDRSILYAAYKFQFIYPAEDLLAVYELLYDFILQSENNVATSEYFYRNVVNLSSKTVQWDSVLEENRKVEAAVFRLAVSSGDRIEVALTDEKQVKDINRRIAARRKLRAEEDARVRQEEIRQKHGTRTDPVPEPMSDEELEILAESIDYQVPATLSHAVISFIRGQLRRPDHQVGTL